MYGANRYREGCNKRGPAPFRISIAIDRRTKSLPGGVAVWRSRPVWRGDLSPSPYDFGSARTLVLSQRGHRLQSCVYDHFGAHIGFISARIICLTSQCLIRCVFVLNLARIWGSDRASPRCGAHQVLCELRSPYPA